MWGVERSGCGGTAICGFRHPGVPGDCSAPLGRTIGFAGGFLLAIKLSATPSSGCCALPRRRNMIERSRRARTRRNLKLLQVARRSVEQSRARPEITLDLCRRGATRQGFFIPRRVSLDITGIPPPLRRLRIAVALAMVYKHSMASAGQHSSPQDAPTITTSAQEQGADESESQQLEQNAQRSTEQLDSLPCCRGQGCAAVAAPTGGRCHGPSPPQPQKQQEPEKQQEEQEDERLVFASPVCYAGQFTEYTGLGTH